ncbi:RHTO0S13e02212g1_1 [Rhodotorula toruloides]|uniref:RHTO0S13e02212g1_1 n=1 Tax=Rhodotorula toruloides TaxID=5286 RepID=A0A061BG02_RHOTO|nr:RHTO0S13e02212g1_1 [Rhodotorula toruloides]
MRLTLVPPSAYPVPPLLQSHVLDPPTLPPPRSLRTPPAWVKAKKALNEVGLQLPSYLAADRALWWQVAVTEVEWNLEEEEIVVKFVDGAEERWALDGGRTLSNELVIDSEVADGVTATPPAPTQPQPKSRWSPRNVLARLRDLSHELRSAYEDLGTSSAHDPLAPDISSESDYLLLMQLSAKPAQQVPFEWADAQTLYEYAMEGLIDEDELDADEGVAKKRPSSDGPSQPGSDGVDSPSRDSHGKFHSRRRPTRTKASASGEASAGRPPHDHLSTIHLLSTIRTFLLDLFAHIIIPHLQQTMPPTYTLWTADAAIVWCRREAVKEGAQVADLILELLDDDGDAFDAAHDDDKDEKMDDIFVEDDAVFLYGEAGVAREQAEEEAKQERLATNPLRSMRDDFALRSWCESALDRHRAMDDLEWDEVTGKPLWIKPVASWDVSKPADGEGSDLEDSAGGLSFGFGGASASSRRFAGSYPSPPTSPPLVDDIPVLPRPHFRSFSTSPDSDATDEEDAASEPDFFASSTSADQYRPEFFRPEDLVGEQFLPPKLPKELLVATGDRGPEMEVQRRSVVELQKKIYELQQFVSKEAGVWEEARAEERKGKPADSDAHAVSGLRSPRPSATSPPPPMNSNKTIPLRAQPLRHQTADRRLSSALHTALNSIAPSEQDRSSMLKKVKLPKSQSATPKPRKRQKFNLENYKRVQALSTMVRADPPEQQDGSTRKKKRKRERHDEAGRGGAFSPTQNALRLRAAIEGSTPPTAKKPRKVRSIKREAASENVLASPSPILRPPVPPAPRRSVSAGVASSAAPSDRHRTVIELSERRRRSLSDASRLAPVMLPSLPVSAVRTGVEEGAGGAGEVEEEEADDEFEEVEVGAKFAEEDELADWDAPVTAPSLAWASSRALHGGDEGVEEEKEEEDEPFGVEFEAPTRPSSPVPRQPGPPPSTTSFGIHTPLSPTSLASTSAQPANCLLPTPVTPLRPRIERSIPFTPVSPQLFISPDLLQPVARRPTQAIDVSPTPTARTTPPAHSSSAAASSPSGLAQRLRNTLAAAAADPCPASNRHADDRVEVGEEAELGEQGSEEELCG